MESHGDRRPNLGADTTDGGPVVEMNDKPHTIVGVLPPIPQYPRENDVYMPTSACPFRAQAAQNAGGNRRAFGALSAFARLEDVVALEAAGSEVGAVAASFARDNRQVYDPDVSQFAARAVGLEEELIQDARPILLTLLGTTILVLLIACANVANLSLARMARREREVAVRLALGAGRGRLVRQLLTESCVMALAGAALGLAVAWTSLDLLAAFASRFTPRVIDPAIDGTVLVFAMGLAMVTGLLVGIVPALSARPSLVSALKDGSAQAGEGAKPARLRSVLVVAQVTVCFALLVGAGLLLDSLRRLASVDLGYRTDSVLTAEIFSNWSRTVTGDDQRRLYTVILERLRSTPGVVSAAVTNAIPLSNLAPGERPIRIEGLPDGDVLQLPAADQRVASDGYFETLEVAPLRGRLFGIQDHQDAPPVAIVNQSMAAFWRDRDPVGGRFRPADGDGEWITVVGVVGDLRQFDLDQEAPAQYYTPFKQTPGIGVRVLLRTIGEPISFLPALKDAVRSGDPTIAVENVQTLRALYADRLASPGLNAALLAIFASVALAITLTGLAGVIGTAVTQRTREFGVRMALGATPSSILRMVLRQGLSLVLIGLAAGTAGALLLGQAVRAYLYETRPGDPVVYLAVGGLFVATAIVACLAPARRATTIDPLRALKAE
jgi:predicted permease